MGTASPPLVLVIPTQCVKETWCGRYSPGLCLLHRLQLFEEVDERLRVIPGLVHILQSKHICLFFKSARERQKTDGNRYALTEDRIRDAQKNIQEILKAKPEYVLTTSEFAD